MPIEVPSLVRRMAVMLVFGIAMTPVLGVAVDPTTTKFSFPLEYKDWRRSLQHYGEFNNFVKDKYHLGTDFSGVSVDIANHKGPRILPVSEGTIALVQHNGKNDHALGNTVIVRHTTTEGPIYSQYSHLHSFSEAVEDLCPASSVAGRCIFGANCTRVVTGNLNRIGLERQEIVAANSVPKNCAVRPTPSGYLGQMGGSGDGVLDRWGEHLHFEFYKTSDLNSTFDKVFGYHKIDPNHSEIGGRDYVDSSSIFNPSGQLPPGTEVLVLESACSGSVCTNLRAGPDRKHTKVRNVTVGERFFAKRYAGPSDGCRAWFEVFRIDGNRFVYDSKARNTPITIEKAWVCEGVENETWLSRVAGEVQTITAASISAVALVLDRSGSMKEEKKLEQAKAAASALVADLSDNSLVSISTFANSPKTHQVMTPVDHVRPNLTSTLDTINASGGTDIAGGLEHGFDEIRKSSAQTVASVVVMTDGKPTTNLTYLKDKDYLVARIPICTVAFGTDADRKLLEEMARASGCFLTVASNEDLVSKFQHVLSTIVGDTTLLNVKEFLDADEALLFETLVSAAQGVFKIKTHWQGSMLGTTLIGPDGRKYRDVELASFGGRYEFGRTYQMLEFPNPAPGTWRIETRWVDPPPGPEQVNILVTEKTDVMASVLPFDPEYRKGKPVIINVMAKSLQNGRRMPLRKGTVRVAVQKPGAELIRLVKAQSANWTMYQDVLADNTREFVLYDDGRHNDYSANDGIFGNTFHETDVNGAYFVRAAVSGEHAGQSVSRNLLASFQVGPISQNQVTSSQTLAYMRGAEAAPGIAGGMYYAPSAPASMPAWQPQEVALPNEPINDIDKLPASDPLQELEQMQGNDPLDAINDLLRAE